MHCPKKTDPTSTHRDLTALGARTPSAWAATLLLCSASLAGCVSGDGEVAPLGSGGEAGARGSSDGSAGQGSEEVTTLAQKYADYFSIGAAVTSETCDSHAGLFKAHFNSVTPEDEMKPSSIQKTEGTFYWAMADKIVDFALENGMAVRGHTLVWHRQNPWWMFVDKETKDPVSKEVLLKRMKDHISAVVGHFKGKVGTWDVVNEAIMNDGSYRTGDEPGDEQSSPWYAIAGESYIAEAFRYAHEADPDAKLIYNDFYNYLPEKQQGIYDMLNGLLDDGVPVHGVGLQCHLNIEPSSDKEQQSYFQTTKNLEKAIELYASLGIEVHITELDLSLYISGIQYTEDTYYTAETFTEELEERQAERYRVFFELFRKHKDAITNVTFWGAADDVTWLSELRSGRTDFPLLFDTHQEPKKAFDAVMDF